MDFLKNLISILSNSNIDLSNILSMFGQNISSTQNNEGNLTNIVKLLSSVMSNTQTPPVPANYKPLDYNEVYSSLLDE